MTEQERRDIKAKLIELGFWGADEAGDPTSDIEDAAKLKGRLDAKLADGVYLGSRVVVPLSLDRELLIWNMDQEYQLVTASNYIEGISLAALALPEFLREHPECAADRK